MPTKITAAEQVEKLLQQQKALAAFGIFAFRQSTLQPVLEEAARVCAKCLGVPFSKICRYRATENDLLVVAGHGWKAGVVGYAISVANQTSPQGLAFQTGEPQVCPNIAVASGYSLPAFYPDHGVVSTVDVLVAAEEGPPFGVLEVDSQLPDAFDEHDITFLTSFANILAEAVATATRARVLQETIDAMAKLIDEKETLSQELKHRVRNNLHLVYGLLTAELDSGHDSKRLNTIRAIALRVITLAEVFDHLLGVGLSRVISFDNYIIALCLKLPELYQGRHVNLVCRTDPLQVELDVATTLAVILTELVNNAYLHAFPDGAGEISVVLNVGTNHAVLSVGDNGVGFIETKNQRRGLGLVRRLVRQVGGALSRRSGHGTTWSITLPVEHGTLVSAS